MIIGVDGNEANVNSPVGVSVYTRALLEGFQKRADSETQFEVYLRTQPLPDLPPATEYFRYVIVTPSPLWSRIGLPLYFATHRKPDVLFCPAHYSPPFHSIPLVVTIHDLAYKQFPAEFNKDDLYKLERWTEQSIQRAKSIIAVSHHTKDDLTSYYPQVASKITTVYNGFTPSNTARSVVLPAQFDVEKKKYLLCVATFQPRKNIETLITAFETFRATHPDFKLLLIGKKGWMYERIFKTIAQSPANEAIITWTEPLSRAELNACYRNAFATVLPSLYEGFGLPVLEALSNDGVVVASSVSSLPEVGGDAALYCDPKDSQTIVDQLERLMDPVVRRSLAVQRKQQLKKFSWDQCAEQTLQIIRSASHEN